MLTHCIKVWSLPQCCHRVAQLMYNSTEQQGNEKVGQLAGGQIDTGDLKARRRHTQKKKCDWETIEAQQEHKTGITRVRNY